jgi:FkbM family methyltransferase
MESQPHPTSFSARANDLECRHFSARLSRFVRARLRRWCDAGRVLADDPRVRQAWQRGWDGAHFIQLQRWHEEGFHPGVVYDIGAHEGLWSEMCQDIFTPAKCILFEPQREFQQKAKARQPKTGADWEVLPFALGDREEVDVLHITQNAAASSLLKPLASSGAPIPDTQSVAQDKVQVLPLDSLVRTRSLPLPDLVKIDVQGFEGHVLAGGRTTISHAQRVVVEVSLHALYEGQSLMPEVLDSLVDMGFELDDLNETFRQWPGRLWQVDLWLRRR